MTINLQLRSPRVGEIVLFTPNPDDTISKSNHNPGDIAAIVTRVWSAGCVNIKIIPDCGPMQDRTSVVHQSLNPAGYHFKFTEEVYSNPITISDGVKISTDYSDPRDKSMS